MVDCYHWQLKCLEKFLAWQWLTIGVVGLTFFLRMKVSISNGCQILAWPLVWWGASI